MTLDGQNIALILSILGLLATGVVYKLGIDVRKHHIKKQKLTFKERLTDATHKRWKQKES